MVNNIVRQQPEKSLISSILGGDKGQRTIFLRSSQVIKVSVFLV